MKFGLALLLLLNLSSSGLAGEAEFDALVEKMEQDVLELARKVEQLYQTRCDSNTIEQCSQGNYDNCVSEYPNPVCLGGDDRVTAGCGDGIKCSELLDHTVSNIRLPEQVADAKENNPSDHKVIETVCFSRQLDEWFIDKYETDKTFWEDSGVRSPQMYYGANNGAFRIYPARYSNDCGWFDPRQRPWYIAGSSGPKNIILMLDTSGSMVGLRLDLMKQAAKQVIRTLTVGDRVAIIPFATQASLEALDGQYLYTATEANKQLLINAIDKLEAVGGTNFYDAFVKAYNVLENSADIELHVSCNTAFLFLTDGEMTEPENKDEQDVMTLVKDGLQAIENRLGRPALLFTYSISENDDVHDFPRQLACSSGDFGVWSKIVDDDDIFDSLTSYYLLFALGLGADRNANFTAWVEPYTYDNTDILGITVSAPVYDRTTTPHLFLGVVGVDFPLSAVDRALGVEEGSQESIDRIVLTSTAKCPTINLTLCELESYRRQGSAGNAALCTSNCSSDDFVKVEDESCSTISDYPRFLWGNTNNLDKSYEDIACCEVGTTVVSEQCAAEYRDDGLNMGAVLGGAIGGTVGLLLLLICCRCRKGHQLNEKPSDPMFHRTAQGEGGAKKSCGLDNVTPMPPPPPMNPMHMASAPPCPKASAPKY